MKKFAMAAVAAAAMTAGVAQAYTVGSFTNGFVVPNVIHNGAADTTAVGIINQSGGTRALYWTFFDQNSNHITDGCFTMTNKDYQGFVWSAMSGAGLSGQRGYLVFAAGSGDAGLTAQTACAAAATLMPSGVVGQLVDFSANAFQVNVAAQDVAFVPVIDGDLTIAGDLTTMGPASLTAVGGAAAKAAGATVTPVFSMRYYIDGVVNSGNDTRIVVWSTGDQRGTHTVNAYDDKQDRKSVNFKLNFAELDWFDPETIAGLPATHTDGFIEWNPGLAVPADYPVAGGVGSIFNNASSIFTYSLISAPAFGAVQTVLGAHQ